MVANCTPLKIPLPKEINQVAQHSQFGVDSAPVWAVPENTFWQMVSPHVPTLRTRAWSDPCEMNGIASKLDVAEHEYSASETTLPSSPNSSNYDIGSVCSDSTAPLLWSDDDVESVESCQTEVKPLLIPKYPPGLHLPVPHPPVVRRRARAIKANTLLPREQAIAQRSKVLKQPTEFYDLKKECDQNHIKVVVSGQGGQPPKTAVIDNTTAYDEESNQLMTLKLIELQPGTALDIIEEKFLRFLKKLGWENHFHDM